LAAGNKRRFPFTILFLAMALAAGSVLACSVPVFRYALERWEPGLYVLMVFHRGPMAPADKEPVELITKGSLDGGGNANIWIRTVDVSADMEEFEKAIWSGQDDPALPWAVLLYPPRRMAPPGPAIWRGRLTKDMTKAILDSPARQEIARRLQAGDSAVWIYLADAKPVKKSVAAEAKPIGTASPTTEFRTNWSVAAHATAAILVLIALCIWAASSKRYVLCVTAFVLLIVVLTVARTHRDLLTVKPEIIYMTEIKVVPPRLRPKPKPQPPEGVALLEAKLRNVVKELVLPKMDPYDAQWGPGGTPIQDLQRDLKISFSAIRVSRSDPAEEMLVRMLMRSEPDLETEHAGKPMVFAVFGRGRVLHALVGEGITAENIMRDCRFLVGPCSCQVKDLNPGTDLLISAAWVTNEPLVQEFQLPPLADLSKDVAPDEVLSAPGMTPTVPADAGRPPREPPPAGDARPAMIQKIVILGSVIIAITVALAVYVRRQSSGN